VIITLKIRTQPRGTGAKEVDHAEILISDVQSYLQDRFPQTEIVGVEWGAGR